MPIKGWEREKLLDSFEGRGRDKEGGGMHANPSMHDQISIDNSQFLCMIRLLLTILSFSAKNTCIGLISGMCIVFKILGEGIICPLPYAIGWTHSRGTLWLGYATII